MIITKVNTKMSVAKTNETNDAPPKMQLEFLYFID